MNSPLVLFVALYLLQSYSVVPTAAEKSYIRKKGYCMWYGQCGVNPSTMNGQMNCLYNGKAKNITDEKSRVILEQLCPEVFLAKRGVCCDYNQLYDLQSGIQAAQQMMARCPACWKNFRQLYCQMTCSPDNSLFINANKTFNTPGHKTGLEIIDYYVDPSFRDGLYNSCKNVPFPDQKKKIMSFLCGTTVTKCNPLAFLRFMGDPEKNDVSPFKIQYPEKTRGIPGIKGMNVSIKLWSAPGCQARKEKDFMNKTFAFGPFYRIAQIIFSVKPEFRVETCYKNFFSGCKLTGSIFKKNYLLKVLDVQNHLTKMSVDFDEPDKNSYHISLEDVCMKSLFSYNNNCTVLSVLQYWQNDAKKLNICLGVLDFPCMKNNILASWGDHLVACANNPTATNDTTALGQSCISSFGEPVPPNIVLGGYSNNYTDASNLIVTFVIKHHLDDSKNAKAKAWEKQFIDYMKNYEDEKLEVAFSVNKPVMILG